MPEQSRVHVTFTEDVSPDEPVVPRCYTLTHSDITGELFLTIGAAYDRTALRALQVRLERDEVLGEWVLAENGPCLALHMIAQGGLRVFGTAKMRCNIFRHYRPMVLAAMRSGDSAFTRAHPELEDARVVAHFHWPGGREETEDWGTWVERRPAQVG